MLYNINYDVAALILISIVLSFFYCRKQMPLIQNKMFVTLAWSVFTSVAFDLICGIGQSFPQMVSRGLLWALNSGYFISRECVTLALVFYVISLADRLRVLKRRDIAIMLAPFAIATLAVVISPFTNFVFTITADNNYQRGSGIFLTYGMALVYIAFASFYTWKNRYIIEASARYAIYGFVLMSMLPVVIQYIFPELLIEGFGISLCLLLMYMAIQRPEELLDNETGFLNRDALLAIMPARLASHRQFYFVYFTVDEYATLSKTIGVVAMKKIIVGISSFLKQHTEASDIYRISSSEFGLVLDTHSEFAMRKVTDLIITRFKSSWNYDDGKMRINISICVIDCPKQADNIETLLEHIGTAEMHSGKNQLLLVEDLTISPVKRKSNIKIALESALKNNSFKVFYQPIYSCKSGKVESAEALIRLTDSALGFISPEEFIPVAEDSGHILRMGRFVLSSVCDFYARAGLRERGIKYIDVNLSVIECVQDNLVAQFSAILARYDVPPSSINLEITETAQSYSLDVLKNNAFMINESGFALSLDDFGTGYSTMTYMLDLPFKVIKLDKSIVWAAFESIKARELLKSIIMMIQKLDLRIVAEGVETREQALQLAEWGCEYLQGYYFSRPVPEEEFLGLLDKEFPI